LLDYGYPPDQDEVADFIRKPWKWEKEYRIAKQYEFVSDSPDAERDLAEVYLTN
jgi:hypothetical protein